MNVRVVPRGQPQRTDTYTGIAPPVNCNGQFWFLYHWRGGEPQALKVEDVAEIALDDEGAVS